MTAITGLLGSGLITLQSAQTGNSNGTTTVVIRDFSTLTIQVNATAAWDGTLNFEMTLDDSNWSSIRGTRKSDGTVASSTTGNSLNEIWDFDIAGGSTFRSRTATTTAGSVTVIARALP